MKKISVCVILSMSLSILSMSQANPKIVYRKFTELHDLIDAMNKSMEFYNGTVENRFGEAQNLSSEAREKYQECLNCMSELCNQLKITADIVIPSMSSNQFSEVQKNVIQNITATVLIPGFDKVAGSLKGWEEIFNKMDDIVSLFHRFLVQLYQDFWPNGFYEKERIRLQERLSEVRALKEWFQIQKNQIRVFEVINYEIRKELEEEKWNLYLLQSLFIANPINVLVMKGPSHLIEELNRMRNGCLPFTTSN